MQRFLRFGAMLFICAKLFACTPAAPPVVTKEMVAVSGHYYLQGATEVGSELLLRKDGKFQWMLAYGAVDQRAEGTWQMTANDVELSSSGSSAPFNRLKLVHDNGKLAMNDPETQMKGVYVKQPAN